MAWGGGMGGRMAWGGEADEDGRSNGGEGGFGDRDRWMVMGMGKRM